MLPYDANHFCLLPKLWMLASLFPLSVV